MKEKVVLIGGGGHCKVVIDAIRASEELEIYGITDTNLSEGSDFMGIKILGSDKNLPGIFSEGITKAFIGVGSVGDCRPRVNIDRRLQEIGFDFPVIKHPAAVIARDARLGAGTFIAAGAVINTGTVTGRHVIVNTSASVDHDCAINDHVHIAPGVTLSGGVEIGERSHIGTGANIIQCVKIGKRCAVGAGTTVRHEMKDGTRNFTSGVQRET